jgi:hypothetical protein
VSALSTARVAMAASGNVGQIGSGSYFGLYKNAVLVYKAYKGAGGVKYLGGKYGYLVEGFIGRVYQVSRTCIVSLGALRHLAG